MLTRFTLPGTTLMTVIMRFLTNLFLRCGSFAASAMMSAGQVAAAS
jgi:hypothetical protein